MRSKMIILPEEEASFGAPVAGFWFLGLAQVYLPYGALV